MRGNRPHPIAENLVYGMAIFLALSLALHGAKRLWTKYDRPKAPAPVIEPLPVQEPPKEPKRTKRVVLTDDPAIEAPPKKRKRP
jgi:hypothetical protein